MKRLLLFILLLSLPVLAQEVVFKDGFENHVPVIVSTPVTIASLGDPYSYDVDATDIDGDTLLYLLTTSPAGMAIDPASGLIGWTPANSGIFDVTVKVSDGQSGSAQQSWMIAVSDGLDSDNDGLSDIAEEELGTDPGNPDSDDDGLKDGDEFFIHKTNPLDDDTDDDGLKDGDEVNTHGTEPLERDTDGDFFGDGFELTYGTDPLNPADFPNGPPDPEVLATDNDPTVTTTLLDSVAFLFSGSPPVQTGVAEGTIDPLRVAVLRGQVFTRNGDPLPGVVVSIKDHAELGQTLSRVNGRYDLVVNGGGVLTVDFNKSGYLPAQRTIDTPWQQYQEVAELALIPLDTQATAIDMSLPSMQMAQGSVSNDSDGSRQATLMIPAGTSASLMLEGGGSQPIQNLTLRATEYTVGDMGPMTMPADLPPASGYTYAVEFSADEAFAEGVTGVQFSAPLYSYVENFLGFPVGSPVPVGYYDRDKAQWIASANGLVIKIVGESGGLAQIDIDGDDAADSGSALSDLGFTDAERQNLAGAYSIGQELWRFPVEHFTPYDCNWPYGPPLDALPPYLPPPRKDTTEIEQCKETVKGSIIECQNQVLGYEAPVTGTPFQLVYRSTDVPGRKTGRTLNISLSGSSVPASLKRIELEITIAGRTYRQAFPALANQSTVFTWNGKDAYQRDVFGSQLLTGFIGHVYDAVYYEPREWEAVFNRFGDIPNEGVGARDEFVFYQPITAALGNFEAREQGLGGWRLDIHNAYNPVTQTLVGGGGFTRGASVFKPDTITTVAGVSTDEEGGYSGDGGPATLALLSDPHDVLVLPDGAFLIADQQNDRIRQVSADGIITTIVGTGVGGSTGDGGLAINAQVDGPVSLDLGPDGSIYLAEFLDRIRKITPDGIIQTIAGTGVEGHSGDGGPATAAQISYPRGIAVAPDGTVYFAESGTARVRRIGTDGIIDTIAGTGESGFSGDGGPAINAKLRYPIAVALASDGSIFIAEEARVRRIGLDGVINTIAGTGVKGYSGDGGLSTSAQLEWPEGIALGRDGLYISDGGIVRKVSPDGIITTVAGVFDAGTAYGDNGPPLSAGMYSLEGLAVDAQDRLYIVDRGASHIRRVQPAMPGFDAGDIGIASGGGAQYFQFNQNGKHQRTFHSLTGAVMYEFSYDADGRLQTISDGDGKVTTIQRNGSGEPVAIVGPFGQQTSLTTDINGYLSSITNPAGESLVIDASPDGLIMGVSDPRGKQSTYTYDALGRLLAQSDNAGYSQGLVRAPSADGFSVTRTTGLGRSTSYDVQFSSLNTQHNTNTAPDGSQFTAQFSVASGANQSSSATGMVQSVVEGPDPRFGMQAPLLSSIEITAPGGPTFTASSSSAAVLSNPADPLSLVSISNTATIDGRTSNSAYDAASRTEVTTSPAGRIQTTTIDSLGRMTSYQFADLAPVVASYNALGQLEMLISGTGGEARATNFTYGADGFWQKITDPLGRSVNYVRDAAGRVTTKALPGGVLVLIGYNAAGELDSITPPGQPEHAFTYTLHGQPQSITPPAVAGSGPTSFAYNVDRQVTSITRPGEEQVIFDYDTEGRVQTIELSESGTTAATYSYSYVVANQLDTITGPGAQTVSYDYQGDLVTGATWGGVVDGSISWSFDSAYRLSSESVTGGTTIAFSYDDDDLLTGIGAMAISRNPVNGLAQSAVLGVVNDAWTHDAFGEVDSYSASVNATPIYEASYTRNKLGRITQKVETIGGITNTYNYGYNLRGQLVEVQENNVVIESYSYDDNGNRLSATIDNITLDSSYDDQDRLISYGGNTYEYTGAGRLLTRTEPGNLVTEYDYDIVGNLRGVTLPDATEVGYGLDGSDRRVQRSVDGAIFHRFLYDGIQPVAELDEFGGVVSQFIYAGGNVPVYLIKGGVNYRIVSDTMGSVRLVVNATTGVITQRLDYDSFGNVLNDTNPGFQPFGFAGGLYDVETGLILFGMRDYDTETGRWTAKDPIGFSGDDTNLYRYANNNPVNIADPTGADFADTFLGYLGGIPEGFLKNLNPMLRLNLTIEGWVDSLLGDWLDAEGFYRKPYAGMLFPPPSNSDPSDYLDGHFYGQCIADVLFSVVDGVVGLASEAPISGLNYLEKVNAAKKGFSGRGAGKAAAAELRNRGSKGPNWGKPSGGGLKQVKPTTPKGLRPVGAHK